MTRKELSTRLHISFSMIEKVERGVRRASPDLAKGWANELGIDEEKIYKYFFAYTPDNRCKKLISAIEPRPNPAA